MKLNLGCGTDVKDGYVNVDFRKIKESVLQVDLSQFPWPFKDNSADEILMLDFLEHFPYAKTLNILLECYRILKDGAGLVIQVPDAGHLSKALTMDGDYLCNRCGESMFESAPPNPRHGYDSTQFTSCPKCGQSAYEIADAAMKRLYGGQDYEGNYHYTAFTKLSLEAKAREAGFVMTGLREEEHQYANWNLKAVFIKGNLW